MNKSNIRFGICALALLALSITTLTAQWVVKHVDKNGPTILDLQMHPQGLGLAVGDEGLILRSEDHGESWKQVSNSIAGSINQVAFVSADTVLISSHKYQSYGALHRSVDGGLTWNQVYSDPDFFLSLQFFNDSVGLASGINTIIRTLDGGESWMPVYDLPVVTSFKTGIIWMDIATDSIAYAGIWAWESGLKNLTRFLLKSINGGQSWETIFEFEDDIGDCAIFFFDEQNGFLAEDEHLLQTKDGGMTWETTENIGFVVDMSKPSDSRIYSVNHPYAYIYFPTYYAISQSLDSGLTWQGKMEPGAHLEAIQFLNDSVGFVAGDYSLIMKTEHRGGLILGNYPWELYTSITNQKGKPITWNIYPNPTSSMLHLTLMGTERQWSEIHVKIIRPDGKVVLSTPMMMTNANMEIPVSTLPAGAYILQLTDAKGQLLGVEKVVVE